MSKSLKRKNQPGWVKRDVPRRTPGKPDQTMGSWQRENAVLPEGAPKAGTGKPAVVDPSLVLGFGRMPESGEMQEFGEDGFDPEGFDKDGYDWEGYDRDGYNHRIHDPRSTEDILFAVSKMTNPKDREAVASRGDTNAEVLDVLARDRSIHVRMSAAHNRATPESALRLLAKSKDRWVVHAVAHNPSTGLETLEEIAAGPHRVSEGPAYIAKAKLSDTG